MEVFGRKKHKKEVEALCEEILMRIEINGYYLLPVNFEHEKYKTSLHIAFRKLISEGIVEIKGAEYDCCQRYQNYNKWGRVS